MVLRRIAQVKLNKCNIKKEINQKTINIVEEAPLTIYINGEEFVTLLCTPTHIKELAVGFLAAEKIISTVDEIEDVTVDNEKGLVWVQLKSYQEIMKFTYGKRYLTSGCGKGTVFYHLNDVRDVKPLPVIKKFPLESILSHVKDISKRDDLGGIHKAALIKDGQLLEMSSDVGRHNAVDKVFGSLILKKQLIKPDMLIATGRISSEILTKAYTIGTPVVVSLSSPTALSLEIAEELNITVIGYARGRRANIYSVPERIKVV